MYEEAKFSTQAIEENIAPENYEWIGIIYPEDKRPKSELITPLAYYNYQE